MSISQTSVFMQSKPGHMSRILSFFEEKGISVRGFSASDTGDYGIVRFILDKPEEAIEALTGYDVAAKTSQVLCVRLEDKPGELARVMKVLADCDINVTYTYSLIGTYIVVSVKDVAAAEEILAKEPIELVSINDIKEN